MSRETQEQLEALLLHVEPSRRDLLKRLLMGGGAVALLAPMSKVLAAGTAPPKSKAAISKCITAKFAASTDGGKSAGPYARASFTVSDKGAVVLNGEVATVNDRNNAEDIAWNCGATKLTDNLTAKKGAKKARPR
jgi:hypothetical protein